jgi:MFS family permease
MFFLIFFSYTTILVHETTLNGDLGTVVLGVGFGVYAFCNTFVSFVQKLLGSRLSLALGTASYVCFMVAHLYPQPVLLISSAVVLAIGASLLWNAQASFLAMHGDERSFGLLAGIFYFFYAWTAVAGNLFSAVFFEHQGTVTVFIVVLTVSVLVSYIPFALLKDPRTFRPFTTLDDTPSLSLMCSESQSENGGVALIHGQLGNDVNNNDGVELIDGREEGNDVEQDSSMRGRNAANDVAVSAKITETLRLFGDTRMLRMVPLMCWFGFATAFWYGGVPARVVVVSDMKQAEIGWLNTAWGVSNAVSAIAFGALGDRVPRAAVVCVALAISFLGCVLSHFFAVHRSVAFFVAVLFGW